jgi:cytochrome c553
LRLMGNWWTTASARVVFTVLLVAVGPLAHAQMIEEKAAACAACHGENGIPPDKTFPVIWGQHLGYLYLQLRDFKSGARKSDAMAP